MNGYNGYYQDPLEAYDGDVPFDDESAESIAEFNPIGAIFNPIGAISSGIGSLLSGGSRRSPVRPTVRVTTAPGVRAATLHTPRGSAQLQLPEEVVTKREFEQVTQQLNEDITKVTARINTVEQQDLPALKRGVGAIVADTRKAVAEEKMTRHKEIAKLRAEQKSQQSTNSIFNLILVRGIQKQLAAHHHGTAASPEAVPEGSGATPTALSTDDSTILFPLLFSGAFDASGTSGDSASGLGMNPLMLFVLLQAFNPNK